MINKGHMTHKVAPATTKRRQNVVMRLIDAIRAAIVA